MAQPMIRDRQQQTSFEDLKHTFIRNVQHELRTPVAIIMGYANLLENGDFGALDQNQQRAISAITNQAQVLRVLIDRITTLLDLESCEFSQQPLTITDIVAAVTAIHQPEADRAGIDLTTRTALNLPLIAGNPTYLKQAVACLVENAVKFTPENGHIRVEAAAEAGWISLAVTDTGIGIAADKLDYVFETFYQVDGSPTRPYNGLGLGLAVAKAVVEAHGGVIEVDSRPGQGSCFTIRLPAMTRPVDRAPVEKKAPYRILIVDDEDLVAMTLQEGLEKLPNCQIETATSGAQALQIFKQQPCDVLITDYCMPDIDGLTLAGEIRKHYPHTAIVVITAYGESVLHEHPAGLPVHCIIDKPVKLADIRNLTLKMLAGPDHRPGSQQIQEPGSGQGLCAAANAEFAVDVIDMPLDRPHS